MFIKKIGIDLGTANILVFLPGEGIVVNEPSVVAISLVDNKVLAVGNEAKEMLGRTPEAITAMRPLKDGVIADYRITEAMLRYFINKVAGGFRLFRPEVMVSIPAGVTSTERRAVVDATVKAVEAVDSCVGKIVEKVLSMGGAAIITADHGNAEEKLDVNGNVITAHSTNPVNVVVVGKGIEKAKLRDGSLRDISPTLLELVGKPLQCA